jgi:hypothetical protein
LFTNIITGAEKNSWGKFSTIHIYTIYTITSTDHTTAEVVSRWLPTVAARVHAWVWQVGFVVDKVASGQVFSEYFGSPSKTIHSTNFSIIIIITITQGSQQSPCNELITGPRSTADCPRSSNRNEMESFMEAAKAQNWAVEPQKKNIITSVSSISPLLVLTLDKQSCDQLTDPA